METVLSFCIVIVLVVFFHELGHYLAARACGVKVEVFSIGFGPSIASQKDRNGTEWRICILPFGGYVKMLEKDIFAKEDKQQKPPENSFSSKSLGQRLIIIFAGPLASIIFGWSIFYGLLAVYGQPVPPNYIRQGIGGVVVGGVADKAGLKAGDVVVRVIDGEKKQYIIKTFFDLYGAVQKISTGPATFFVDRAGVKKTFFLSPRPIIVQKDDGIQRLVYQIGVKSPLVHYRNLSLQEALVRSVIVSQNALSMILRGYKELFLGHLGMDAVGGPVKIAQLSADSMRSGAQNFLGFIALFSINLGIINLFPIPIADGGRIVLLCLEGVRRRPMSPRVSYMLTLGSLWFILSIFLLVTLHDLNFM